MRELFELDPKLIYLNAGTHSICPREVLEETAAHQRAFELNPTSRLLDAWTELWEAQVALARFFGARAEDLFFRANVTEALNAFVLGVPLPSDGEILITDLEYGAIVNLTRYRAEQRGLSLRVCPATEVVENLGAKTRLVVMSHVCTGTGLVTPLKKIAAATRARGIVLAIDGAHAPGALPLDFSELEDVDFYGGNLHKWMMGPKGTGFGWVHPRHHTTLVPIGAGWATYEEPDFLEGFGQGNRFAQRFAMLGCRDFAPFLAIPKLLAFWERLGSDRIRARIKELQTAMEQAMAAQGWRTISPPAGSERGPLLSYDLRDELQSRGPVLLREILGKHRLQVQVTNTRGRWRLRLSPHIYNTVEETTRAAELLTAYLL